MACDVLAQPTGNTLTLEVENISNTVIEWSNILFNDIDKTEQVLVNNEQEVYPCCF